jgi:hypothetical protein
MVQKRYSTSAITERYDFALANLAATQTGTAVPVLGGVISTYVMPVSGFVVGYAINMSAAFTAGTAVINITKNGTVIHVVNIAVASTTKYYTRFPIPDFPFAAGDTIGVTYTTNGSADPTTNDVVVNVFANFQGFSF